MLLQIHVADDVDVRVEILRKAEALTVQQPADTAVPQHLVIKEEPQAGNNTPNSSGSDQHAGQMKGPVLLYVAGHIQGPSRQGPARLTAAGWVDSRVGASDSLSLVYNIRTRSSAVTRQMADLGALYAALTSPKLAVFMQNKAGLHVICGDKRSTDLINSAQMGSKQFDVALAAQIRHVALEAPFPVVFKHEPARIKGPGAAGLKKARAKAIHCDKHESVCCLPAHARLMRMGCQKIPVLRKDQSRG